MGNLNSKRLVSVVCYFIICAGFPDTQAIGSREADPIGKKGVTYRIVDTGQDRCFSNTKDMWCPGRNNSRYMTNGGHYESIGNFRQSA